MEQSYHEDSLQEKCAVIYTDDDVPSGHPTAQAMYGENNKLGRELLTHDVLAIAKGFFARGISCVDVIDTHNDAIDPIPLNKNSIRVLTLRDHLKELQDIHANQYQKYGVAALVGFHAPASKTGINPHSFDDSVKHLKIQKQVVGEVAYQIMSFASAKIPVAVISGSKLAVDEAEKFVPGIQGLSVRWLDEKGKIHFIEKDDAYEKLYEMEFSC